MERLLLEPLDLGHVGGEAREPHEPAGLVADRLAAAVDVDDAPWGRTTRYSAS
jgi:hypothetical protein